MLLDLIRHGRPGRVVRRVIDLARNRALESGGDPSVAEAVYTAMIETFIAFELRSRHEDAESHP